MDLGFQVAVCCPHLKQIKKKVDSLKHNDIQVGTPRMQTVCCSFCFSTHQL